VTEETTAGLSAWMMGGTVSVQVLQEKEESPYDRTNSNIDTIY